MTFTIEQLEELCAKATKGPWTVDGEFVECATRDVCCTYSSFNPYEDAKFIAAARTAIPELVAELKQLRELAKAVVDTHYACVPYEETDTRFALLREAVQCSPTTSGTECMQ